MTSYKPCSHKRPNLAVATTHRSSISSHVQAFGLSLLLAPMELDPAPAQATAVNPRLDENAVEALAGEAAADPSTAEETVVQTLTPLRKPTGRRKS